ncbi:hypothetical protein Ccrd_012782 [Cynara cardunculus var. scolymus]|uniref:Bifunctional inhibitor/plant lipid transfer protein/seed storage helical domain-containing protein n=1 Tax=Cynara cardunculus var. scolymus TaxID=59895 RepID=A0A103YGU6_CYNCS|nr:hypothetical protein Ccrd_012782 [Cynara cardunculus var. scolymus]
MVKNNLVYVVVVALLMVTTVHKTDAVVCNLFELSPCLGPALFFVPPSGSCCGRLREQEPCLCEYVRTLTYGRYLSSFGARRVVQACGMVTPQCYG